MLSDSSVDMTQSECFPGCAGLRTESAQRISQETVTDTADRREHTPMITISTLRVRWAEPKPMWDSPAATGSGTAALQTVSARGRSFPTTFSMAGLQSASRALRTLASTASRQFPGLQLTSLLNGYSNLLPALCSLLPTDTSVSSLNTHYRTARRKLLRQSELSPYYVKLPIRLQAAKM